MGIIILWINGGFKDTPTHLPFMSSTLTYVLGVKKHVNKVSFLENSTEGIEISGETLVPLAECFKASCKGALRGQEKSQISHKVDTIVSRNVNAHQVRVRLFVGQSFRLGFQLCLDVVSPPHDALYGKTQGPRQLCVHDTDGSGDQQSPLGWGQDDFTNGFPSLRAKPTAGIRKQCL